MGFAIFIQLGIMLRHFADFAESLRELRASGQVTLGLGAASVEPITGILKGSAPG